MATRTKHERESDLDLINKLYLQHWSQQAIADELSVIRNYELSQRTISNDLKEVQKRWSESTTIDLDEAKGKELARIDQLEREYWEQYEASKEDKSISSKKQLNDIQYEVKDGKTKTKYIPKGHEATTRTETRTGDPRYLAGVERCIKLRMDLLGLEAPKRTGGMGEDGEHLVKLSWEQLIRRNKPGDPDATD